MNIDTIAVTIHLTDGEKFESTVAATTTVLPADLTEKTVWKFPLDNGKKVLFVQGHRIKYIVATNG